MGRKKLESNSGTCNNGCNSPIHCRGVCKSCYRKLHYAEHERERRGATEHVPHPIGTIRDDGGEGYSIIKIDSGHGAKDWVKHHR